MLRLGQGDAKAGDNKILRINGNHILRWHTFVEVSAGLQLGTVGGNGQSCCTK